MKLTDVLTADLVKMDLASATRDDCVKELVGLLAERGELPKERVETLVKAVLDREQLGSTSIGKGMAVPHARTPAAPEFLAAMGRSKGGIEFAAADGRPVHLVFLLASPPETHRAHLRVLAHISRLAKRQDLGTRILSAETPQEVLAALGEAEAE